MDGEPNEEQLTAGVAVKMYIQMREKIDEIKSDAEERMLPFREGMRELSEVLKSALDEAQAASIKTEDGVAFRTTMTSATITDFKAFATWAASLGGDLEDVATVKPKTPVISEHVEEHGAPPPGVSISRILLVRVRRS